MSAEADAIKGRYFKCLDHGFVCLKDYMGGDEDSAEAARVSYGAGTKQTSDTRGLLRYMMRHAHTSPCEMVELKFHVKLPIFVARQLIRHRTANVNEYSLRYSLPVFQNYMPSIENMGSQSLLNKQGRGGAISKEVALRVRDAWAAHNDTGKRLYEYLVSSEVDLARELARMHLPLSLYTEWYWKIDMHNLMHFLTLRSDSHAQWEIQQYSNLKAAILRQVAPISYEAWTDYKFQSHTFSRMEMQLLCGILRKTDFSELITPDYAVGINKESAKEAGLSTRETEELMAAFDVDLYKPIEFKLNVADSFSGKDMYAEAQKYMIQL